MIHDSFLPLMRRVWLSACLGVAAVILTAAIAGVLMLPGCASVQTSAATTSSGQDVGEANSQPIVPVAAVAGEPMVRVRVLRDRHEVTATSDAAMRIGPSNDIANTAKFRSPVHILRQGGDFYAKSDYGPWYRFHTPGLMIQPLTTPAANGWIALDEVRYPRTIMLESLSVQPGDGERFDAINTLPLESYLPGVLARELYRSWDIATYQAQAIAARTYTIAEMSQSRSKPYDLEATVAHQAYAGATDNAKAHQAAESTRGKVLTWRGEIFPAYYSSCSGGVGQDATVLPDGVDIPPLRGRYQGGWGAASPNFTWGPIQRNVVTLSRRLAAWGVAEHHPIARLRHIAAIHISGRNGAGRPTQFVVRDTGGQQYVLKAEQFRFACNFVGSGIAAVPSGKVLKSSQVDVTVRRSVVHFTNGRGYGHGVGMSQWGAQGMAQKGYSYSAILTFYYPGAVITNAY